MERRRFYEGRDVFVGAAHSTAYLGPGATGGGTDDWSVTYDGFGNIQSMSTVGAATRSTPTSLSTNRLTGSVSYDNAGNMTSWNRAVYGFDALDRLWRMTNGTQDWRHMYTADGERLFSFRANGGPSRWILRDLDGKILREYENDAGTWSVVKDYVYRGNHAAASYTSEPYPQNQVHFHTDHLGSVRALTDSNGNRFSYHLFYPFGEEATSITQDAGRLKFTGHERDLGDFYSAADDLDYMHARYYNPQLGRFLGVDPGRDWHAKKGQSWNRHTYVRNNPLKFVDPNGEALDTFADIAFVGYDLFDIGRTVLKGEEVSKTQWTALAADGAATFVPFATGAGIGVRTAARADNAITMARVRRTGRAGEDAVRGAYNIGSPRRLQVPGATRYRVPDGVTRTAIFEVKNVKRQGYTSQLRDYVTIGKNTGRTVVLFVRRDTKLSKSLREAIANGDITLRQIPE